jgi:nanoRNase/pAp phosphatase (c-di-AMP/oligoRNAs hydrolase)
MSNFKELISNITSNRVYIQTHNFPDPDAIASAYGLKELLKTYNIDAIICYMGKIDRHNTRKMMELFDIKAVNTERIIDLPEDAQIILIDAQKNSGNVFDLPCDNVLSIDHHPVTQSYAYVYSDIRPNVGACASIIASYYFENNIPMTVEVATALLYGIKIDTAQLTRGVSQLDLEMFNKMFFMIDKKYMNLLESSTLELEDLQAYGSAISSITVEDFVSFANTGRDCPEALIAEIADFMVAVKDVNLAVVYSVRTEGIKISIRSDRQSGCHAGQIAIEALEGIGTGGGHERMAGGYISLRNRIESIDTLLEIVRENFKKVVSMHLEKAKEVAV